MEIQYFAAWLKLQLQQRKLSYRKFETKTGVSRANLSRWHAGVEPNIKGIKQLAEAFASLDYENNEIELMQVNARYEYYVLLIFSKVS